eukprot:jgi/Ulvmu1/12015/UM083_0028.1
MTRKAPDKRKQDSREQATIRLVNDAIIRGDLRDLRRVATIRGLGNAALRKKAWPLLLGISVTHTPGITRCAQKSVNGPSSRARRDEETISLDVARSLHHTNAALGDHNREMMRKSLIQMLASVVDAETVYYYQGLHEIAGVVMLEVGENVALQLLARLVTTHLRDCTRHSLDAVIESLHLLYPVIRGADHELAAHLVSVGLPPYFALSWIITWFAHHVPPKDAARLFDLFIASHPLMPMYLFAVVILKVRSKLLSTETMEELHTFLVNFNIYKNGMTVDDMAMQAVKLIHDFPPERAYKKAQFRAVHSCTVEARLVQNTWWVPESPAKPLITGSLVSVLESAERRHPVLISTVGAGVAAVAAAVWFWGNVPDGRK